MTLPRKIKKSRVKQSDRIRCPGHLQFIRGFECCVAGRGLCSGPVEAAHVRSGTDGALSVKPGDSWTISLCHWHHAEQHRIGEFAFERAYGIDMKKLAQEFASKSPALKRYLAKQRRAA